MDHRAKEIAVSEYLNLLSELLIETPIGEMEEQDRFDAADGLLAIALRFDPSVLERRLTKILTELKRRAQDRAGAS